MVEGRESERCIFVFPAVRWCGESGVSSSYCLQVWAVLTRCVEEFSALSVDAGLAEKTEKQASVGLTRRVDSRESTRCGLWRGGRRKRRKRVEALARWMRLTWARLICWI